MKAYIFCDSSPLQDNTQAVPKFCVVTSKKMLFQKLANQQGKS
jgi:hypothetical protein